MFNEQNEFDEQKHVVLTEKMSCTTNKLMNKNVEWMTNNE